MIAIFQEGARRRRGTSSSSVMQSFRARNNLIIEVEQAVACSHQIEMYTDCVQAQVTAIT